MNGLEESHSDIAGSQRTAEERFAFLAELAGDLLAASGSADFLERIYQRLVQLLGIGLYLHYTVTPSGDHLQLVASHGIDDALHPRIQRLAFGQGLCGAVAASGKPVVIDDVQASTDEATSLLRSLGVTRVVCQPLISRCGLIGTLSFGATQGVGFDRSSLVLLRSVCAQATTALDREHAEQALRQSEEHFRLLFEKSTDAILVADDDGWYLQANDAACRLLGYSRQQLLNMNVGQLQAAGNHRAADRYQQYVAKGEETGIFHFLRPDGVDWIAEYSAVNFAPGQHLSILRDVTERQRFEQALQASEERLRTLLETAADAIITIDRHNVIQSLNPAAQQMFGYPAEQAIGRCLSLLMPPPFFEEHEESLSRCGMPGQERITSKRREIVVQRKDGSSFPADLAISAMPQLDMFTLILRDISEHKQLEAEVIRIAEEEQRRIGEALHDDIQQEIAAVGLIVHAAADRLDQLSTTTSGGEEADLLRAARDAAVRAAQIASQTLKHVQALSRSMVPREIDAHGLQAALADMARRMNDVTSAACCFHHDTDIVVKDNYVATHLYRIAQEAVTNAIKHSQADRIDIFLEQQDSRLMLRVRDNGVGIDDRQSPGHGMGLRLMLHRASLIGATISVAPATGGGTEMACSLPLRPLLRSGS